MRETVDWSRQLLAWYKWNQRDLPWRHTRDPYAVLVSEVMLQQTRVETVKEYYRRFLARFPDAPALAAAPEADVLKLWEGLGYYSRARNLQKAAKVVVQKYGGKLPNTYDELLSLPGVGVYTAGAVASIAFGEARAAVDGNVKRVIARLTGERESIERPDVQKRLRERTQAAVLSDDPGSFNQALMELGATLCFPRTPQCERCPLRSACDAYREGDAESLPVHEKKRPAKTVDVAVCLLTFGGKVLVFRRRERLLHGLYVFRLLEGETDRHTVIDLLNGEGLSAVYAGELGEATHVFTHRIWAMKLFHFILSVLPDESWLAEHDAVIADAEALAKLPVPTAMKAAKTAALRLIEDEDETR